MTARLVLLTSGSTPYGGGGEIPTDPDLNTLRVITATLNKNINGLSVAPAGGITVDSSASPVVVMQDSADLRLMFDGRDVEVQFKMSLRKNVGPWVPVLVDDEDLIIIPANQDVVTSDILEMPLSQGDTLRFRSYRAPGTNAGGGTAGPASVGSDQRFASVFVPTEPFGGAGPFPCMITGLTRSTVVSPILFGDSIANGASWWAIAAAENNLTAARLATPVHRFDSARWLEGALDAVTHMAVQFGVNDINSGRSMPNLWDIAVECYDYVQSIKPGLPLWQTTTTPIVSTSDGGATLESQSFPADTNTRRQAWIAFLRDGAPCNPITRAALAVGSGGSAIRAGAEGHPLRGIIDVAAAVEQGGSIAPTGKWRVDQGPIAGDGVHPGGENADELFVGPISAWMSTLT